MAGQVHDLAGDYTIPIYLSGVLGLFAAAIAFKVSTRPTPEPRVAPV